MIGGGDCLTDRQLDIVLARIAARSPTIDWIQPARTWHDAFDPAATRAAAAMERLSGAGAHGDAIVVAWTRHHWACAYVTQSSVTMYDSAPSPPTARDWKRQSGIAWPGRALTIRSLGRQERGSNECGVFALATAVALAEGTGDVSALMTDDKRSLAALRPMIDAGDLSWRDVAAVMMRPDTAAEPAPQHKQQQRRDPRDARLVEIYGGARASSGVRGQRCYEVLSFDPLEHAAPDGVVGLVAVDVDAIEPANSEEIVNAAVREVCFRDADCIGAARNEEELLAVLRAAQEYSSGSLPLRTLPPDMQRRFAPAAKRQVEADAANAARIEARAADGNLATGAEPGAEISTAVVDAIVGAIRDHHGARQRAIFNTQETLAFACAGRPLPDRWTAVSAAIAAGEEGAYFVVVAANHFVLMVLRGDSLDYYDSLQQRAGTPLGPRLTHVVRRIIAWAVATFGVAPRVRRMGAPKQGLNDCGVEALRSLVELTHAAAEEARRLDVRQLIRGARPCTAEQIQKLAREWLDARTPPGPRQAPLNRPRTPVDATSAAQRAGTDAPDAIAAHRPLAPPPGPYEPRTSGACGPAAQFLRGAANATLGEARLVHPGKPEYLSAAAVREAVNRGGAGATLRVVQVNKRDPSRRDVWLGRVDSLPIGASVPARLTVVAEQCESCGRMHPPVEQGSYVLPNSGWAYESVQAAASDRIIPACSGNDEPAEGAKPPRMAVGAVPSMREMPQSVAVGSSRHGPGAADMGGLTRDAQFGLAKQDATEQPIPAKPDGRVPTATCCARPEIAHGLCAWHHPALAPEPGRRRYCTAKTANGRQCREQILRTPGDGPSVRHCYYHLTPVEQAQIEEALTGRRSERIAKVPPPLASAQPLRHTVVRDYVARLKAGQTVVVQRRLPGEAKAWVVAERVHGETALFQTIARHCEVCDEWHFSESASCPAEMEYLPAGDTTYFHVGPADLLQVAGMSPDCGFCDEDDDDDLDGEEDGDGETLRAQERTTAEDAAQDPERQCLWSAQTAPALTASAVAAQARRWYVYHGRPPGVPKVAWASLASTTRAAHERWLRRISAMPPELQRLPLPVAVLELVLRRAEERKWAWSTTASSLSSAAAAVRNLPLHTDIRADIDLRQDPVYGQALARAMRRAKAQAASTDFATLSPAEFETVAAALHGSDAWYLAQVGWSLAARIGDSRQLQPRNVEFDAAPVVRGGVEWTRIRCTYTHGKGARFWGPFTVQAYMKRSIAAALRSFVEAAHRREFLFAPRDQAALAAEIKKLPGHSLRSLRRGALARYAAAGVTDADLMLLSGHKRPETLLRYLGFGRLSALHRQAAERRLECIAAEGDIDGGEPTTEADMRLFRRRMGRFSGHCGPKGRRMRAPPAFFPRGTPSANDLGLPIDYDDSEIAAFNLHANGVSVMDPWAAVAAVDAEDLRAAGNRAIRWTQDPGWYGPQLTDTRFGAPLDLDESQIPISRFTPSEWVRLWTVGKVRALIRGPDGGWRWMDNGQPACLRSAAVGHAVPQAEKHRWRPVFETLYNRLIERGELPPLKYPSRAERRQTITASPFFAQFDLSAYFDQIALSQESQEWHVVRAEQPVQLGEHGAATVFALTRLPMGSSFSAHCAQTLTWCLLEPLLKQPQRVKVYTMIDNVAICAATAGDFVWAVETFIKRCADAGATLNDADVMPRSAAEWIELGRAHAGREEVFLGECYDRAERTVRNSDKNVRKLHAAVDRLRPDSGMPVTRRHVASVIGLANWMAMTIGVPLREHIGVLHAFTELLSPDVTKLDDPYVVSPQLYDTIWRYARPILANSPVEPKQPAKPSYDAADYDIVIVCDACESGWAALVSFAGAATIEVKAGWDQPVAHSAWSEPMAATLALRWARQHWGGSAPPSIAIVGDHGAMATAQRQPLSANGGFSSAFWLNRFYEELYKEPGLQRDVFYIPGECNPADGPSRSVAIGDKLRWTRRDDIMLPPLSAAYHPFAAGSERAWWNT